MPKEFKEYLADIFVKIFQIVFAMLVVGMLLRDRFDVLIFVFGIVLSSVMLTVSIAIYYTTTKGGE